MERKLSTDCLKIHSALRSIYGRYGMFADLISKILYPDANEKGAAQGQGCEAMPACPAKAPGALFGRSATQGGSLFSAPAQCPASISHPAHTQPTSGPRKAFPRGTYPQIFPILIAHFAASTGAAGDLLI
ncbi:MAG: hypothetical protein ACTTJV_03320 [Ottowia sp.]